MFVAETATAGVWPPSYHPMFTVLPHNGYIAENSLPDRLRETQNAPEKNASPRPVDTHADTGTSNPAPAPLEPPQPTKQYSDRWDWDPKSMDYVREKDGVKQFYSEYQKQGGTQRRPGNADIDTDVPKSEPKGPMVAGPSSSEPQVRPALRPPPSPYADPLGKEFQIVEKPKRFFGVGRIFKTVWFEPCPKDMPSGRTELDQWSSRCPGFHGQKPITRFRWFVVVRRRQHHSLCFSITTFGGAGAAKNNRGRPSDYVVLHSSAIEPEAPYEEENITREPIAVIIEDDEQLISPKARLDCGRIYTVEDGLPVMKVGRVLPASLPLLEEYYKDSMA
ncbi:hypothetical protein MFIFM68171_02587 [Madurella fahalii]|uniref:DUF6590 domain-containing protein n=1 Tax=Madurella fahalii TaxID=1157608 RepID=A0ABQ0G3Q1_9PEZI